MSAAADGAVVAFEVEDYQLADRSGWSVLALFRAELIHAVATTFKVLDAGLELLADGRRTAIARMEPTFSRVDASCTTRLRTEPEPLPASSPFSAGCG